MIVTKDDTYGADIDGNRGTTVYEYKLENTPQEKEEIAELLYEYFLEGVAKGIIEITYEDMEIEVEVSDYLDELLVKLKADDDYTASERNEILFNAMDNNV